MVKCIRFVLIVPARSRSYQLRLSEQQKQGNMAFRRLLKDVASGLYYDGNGGWTSKDADAFAFPDTQEAVRAALKLERQSLHLVLKFPDHRLDVSYPLAQVEPPQSPTLPGANTPLILTTFLPAAVHTLCLLKRMVS
jgi:hypothetical protein